MANERTTERTLVLSMQPAGPSERRLAAAAVLLSLVTFVAAVPFARVKLPQLMAFIPDYESTLAINDLITAALLYGQFTIARSRGLLVLASGFLFIALMTVCHTLTYPGLFLEGRVLGTSIQSTVWLYIFWHAGFPLAVVCYALLRDDGAGRTDAGVSSAILRSFAVVVVLVVLLTALATVAESSMPQLMQGKV